MRTTQLMLGHGCRYLSALYRLRCRIKGVLKVCWDVWFLAGKKKTAIVARRFRSQGCRFCGPKFETGTSTIAARKKRITAIRIFVRHPRKDFATVSATCGLTRRSQATRRRSLVGAEDGTMRHGQASAFARRSGCDNELAHIC